MLNATLNHDKGDTMHRTFLGTVALILAALALSFSTAAAEVVASPDSLDFGKIPAGRMDSLSFTLTNTDTDSVLLARLVLAPSPWALVTMSTSEDTVRLAPGEARVIQCRVTPHWKNASVGYEFSYQVIGAVSPSIKMRFKFDSIAGDPDWSPWLIYRSLREQTVTVTGSRVANFYGADVRVVPFDRVYAVKWSTTQDQVVLYISIPTDTPLGARRVIFESGGVALDSIYLNVDRSNPQIYQPSDSLSFSQQHLIDTLSVRGHDFWPGCTFSFPLSNLSVLSAEIVSDSLADLIVQYAPGSYEDFVGLEAVNPDSGRSRLQISVRLNADALPLAPESGSPGAALPRAFSLGANCPNPFNPSTTISYSVGGEAPVPVRLNVFNVRGQIVAALVDRVVAPGQYTVNWDGRGRGGEQLSSGVYFYRLRAGDFSFTRKMVLLK